MGRGARFGGAHQKPFTNGRAVLLSPDWVALNS